MLPLVHRSNAAPSASSNSQTHHHWKDDDGPRSSTSHSSIRPIHLALLLLLCAVIGLEMIQLTHQRAVNTLTPNENSANDHPFMQQLALAQKQIHELQIAQQQQKLVVATEPDLQVSNTISNEKGEEKLETQPIAVPVPIVRAPAVADDCYHVYLDLGTNVGIQIRKLYEPHLFPAAGILPKFDQYFGSVATRASNVCTFAWEPNAKHSARLVKLFDSFKQHLGVKTVTVFPRTGVSIENKLALFTSDKDTRNNEWGGTVIPDLTKQHKSKVEHEAVKRMNQEVDPNDPDAVQLIDFPQWFEDNIVKRRIPAAVDPAFPPKVVMKIDIEGHDSVVIGALVKRGLLCSVNYLYVEHVTPAMSHTLSSAMQFAGCDTTVEYMDDETYHVAEYPLPGAAEYKDVMQQVKKEEWKVRKELERQEQKRKGKDKKK